MQHYSPLPNGLSVADPPNAADADLDGFCVEDGDCDDLDENAHPSANEIPGDNVDNDCDSLIDEDG